MKISVAVDFQDINVADEVEGEVCMYCCKFLDFYSHY